MLPVAAVLVDFDGTACAHDVAFHLLERFGRGAWAAYDDAVEAGTADLRAAIAAQATMLDADDGELLDHALAHCRMDPTFRPFVEWCGTRDVPVTVVSDGFGFYIEPLLRAHGIEGVEVVTNTWIDGRPPVRLAFERGHPECVGCGTCKMRAVVETRDARGPVAFVGDGASDRYGAYYADLVFAKGWLAATCDRDGVPFTPFRDFEDVRARLERNDPMPGPLAPVRCPGWTTG